MRWTLRRAIRLKVMHIQPGDVVVLESDRLLSAEAVERIRAVWQHYAGLEGIEVIVLDGVKAKAILRRKP